MPRKPIKPIISLGDCERYSKTGKDIRFSEYWKKKRGYIKAVLGHRCADCRTTLGDLHVDCVDGNHESTDMANFAVVCHGCNMRREIERAGFVRNHSIAPERRAQVREAMRRWRARHRARRVA